MNHRIRIFVPILAALVAVVACGDSEDSPLGTEFIDDILGSKPGVVFEDSIAVTGDTTYAFYRAIDKQSDIFVGRQQGYERTILLRPDFSSAGADTLKTVDRAVLRLSILDDAVHATDIRVRFHGLASRYNEGDSVAVLDTTAVIRDPDTGAAERELTLGGLAYELPVDIVQAWIRGDSANNGIAVVYAGQVDKLARLGSRESASSPSIQVFFDDGTQPIYSITNDATYVRPVADSDNLVLSDGFVRRTWFNVDLSQVNDSAAVHEAYVVFNIVPGTVFGDYRMVELYVPDSADPSDPLFVSGRLVTGKTIEADAEAMEFPITNALLLVLSGELENNGFVLRFDFENSEVRQAEFYTTANDTMRPKVYITYSTPADFKE